MNETRSDGSRCLFEYHCNESENSAHAEWWHRTHQPVTVLALAVDNSEHGSTPAERGENGAPNVYRVRWDDGFEGDIFEDEAMDDPSEFSRPNYQQRMSEDPSAYADEHESGQLRLAVAGEQTSLLPLPDAWIPLDEGHVRSVLSTHDQEEGPHVVPQASLPL